jgi:hypothetical protein
MAQTDRLIRMYAAGLILCVIALAFGVWNGFARGHWWSFGLFVEIVVTANMAILLRKAIRRRGA